MRRLAPTALMLAALLLVVSVAAATLRRKPKIELRGIGTEVKNPDFVAPLAAINAELSKLAEAEGVELAPPADEFTIARRLSLALVGSGLSLEEVRALQLVEANERVAWWTSYLLQDRRWADYFSERFSRAFVGVDEGPFLVFRRRHFRLWLADQLERGVGYDAIVRSLLTADGLWTDTPQVNFITATIQEDRRADPIRLAGRTARVFLGQRIDCLQCHDDFLGELDFGSGSNSIDGLQEHFHELAAFFSGTSLPEAVFQGIREDNSPYVFKYLGQDQEQEVAANVPFYPDLLPAKGKPRERLAAWVTHNENKAFSRAVVNRVWALMLGKPLVEPIDNIPLSVDSPILEILSDDFSRHGFKLRRLIRLIASCDAFQRSSRAEFEITAEHEACWAAFPLTQLRAEQVAGSVVQASTLTAIDDSSSIFTQLKSFGALQDFLKRFGDRGEDEFESHAVTIQQRLVLMNGKMVRERTAVDLVNNASSRIATLVADNHQAVELVYLATLNRLPSDGEIEAFVKYLSGKAGQERSRAVGDIYWAIFNSTEFSWNH